MKKRINISLDEETVVAIKALAEKSHRNVSQWITDKVWAEYSEKNTFSSSMMAFNENGELAEYSVEFGVVECSKCHKKYKQITEEQVPGFRDRSYDTCPYCGSDNGSSMEIDYINSKI